MSRPLGTPKTGGRRKGTPNRRSTELRDRFEELGFDPVERLATLIPEMWNPDQVQPLLALLPYLYPKHKPTERVESPPEENAPMAEESENEFDQHDESLRAWLLEQLRKTNDPRRASVSLTDDELLDLIIPRDQNPASPQVEPLRSGDLEALRSIFSSLG